MSKTTFNPTQNELLPALPEWQDSLLDLPWSHENSLQLDRWLSYLAAEFEAIDP